ncbi:hypothetical protein [Sinomonas gamaensis]|uniref:hypothetical protein n=1 Tax=Sinomonas gamaensis TaxID=2565624 RepID=UPI0011090314|nr:hypothetical protein [Sinomonas gamaensis]
MDERFYQDLARQMSGMTPGEGRRADLPFLSMVQHVRAFGQATGRFPDGQSSDRHEALLGQWLQQQREIAARGMLGRTLQSFADAAFGRGWAAAATHDPRYT